VVLELVQFFLVIDHNFLVKGPPLVFETMVFGGERDQDCWRYATWQEAEVGHFKAVRELREQMGIEECKHEQFFTIYDILDLDD